MKDFIQSLERLVEAVESARVDIAPSYQEYMPMTFAIANDCGEQGRALFHRLCRLSPKYRDEDADRIFSEALQKGDGQNSLGTVFHLAEQAGVDIKKLSFTPGASHTHTRADARTSYTEPEILLPETEENAEELPKHFPESHWPDFLQQAVDCGEDPAQRDVLLLGALTILGGTMGKLLHFNYGHKEHYPCLQTFVLAPPASGKGVLAWIRNLAEPIHRKMLATFLEELKTFRADKAKWECLGKQRAEEPEPEKPVMKLLYIAGDNSGTGIQENLMNNNGLGIICESEADTVSTAIGADYGQWSHTLRKAFDHGPLAYNRRTNSEYRECPRLHLSVLLSGTPAQLTPLIPSPENGLFSRQVFYHMPPIHEWVNQFDPERKDYNHIFYGWGEQWKALLEALNATVSQIQFRLTPEQQQQFNRRMSQLFSHAGTTHGHHMRSTVARIAINTCRIMGIVAFLRSTNKIIGRLTPEKPLSGTDFVQRLLKCPGLAPGEGIPQENIADGIVPTFTLAVNDTDFQTVMNLVEPLYRHSCHALMYLPESQSAPRKVSQTDAFLAALPMQFARQEALKMADKYGVPANTCDTLLKRLIEKGILQKTDRGQYCFASIMRE